jgi:hypothetical protein
MHVKFWPEIQKERDRCEDVDMGGRTVLKLIFK